MTFSEEISKFNKAEGEKVRQEMKEMYEKMQAD